VPAYLARVTVHADLDSDQIDGIVDALGATGAGPAADGVVLWVPGEAPDLATAELTARRHAVEVLDGFRVDVDVAEDPSR
jgi:hypothetical protein